MAKKEAKELVDAENTAERAEPTLELTKKEKAFKVLNVIKDVFTWMMLAIALIAMIFTIFTVTTFDKTDRDVFGYKFFIVTSDSMEKTDFAAGDLVIVKELDDYSKFQPGDIISFISTDSANFGETVTHKIRKRTTVEDSTTGRTQGAYITYGTTNDTGKLDENGIGANDDKIPVTYGYILGEYKMAIPKLGTFFQFMKTPAGYVVCIFLPFFLLILLQGVNTIKVFRQYKKQQLAEVQAEREQVEVERQETQKVMAELLQLKAQLEEAKANQQTEQAKKKKKPTVSGSDNAAEDGQETQPQQQQSKQKQGGKKKPSHKKSNYSRKH